jgi:hypothetical protein
MLAFAFGVGRGVVVGVGLGLGVGVGVLFALALTLPLLTLALAFKLILNASPMFRFVGGSVLTLGRLMLALLLFDLSVCRNQKTPPIPPKITIVPKIVSKTTFAVFDGGGGA